MNYIFPTTRTEMKSHGIKKLDIILISGEAFIDHPSSGVAIIARLLYEHGYSVGIIDQPDWSSKEDFTRLGRPELFFGVTSGCLDSMLANYTPVKKIRRGDRRLSDYTLPDRAVTVYCNRIKEAYKNIPIVIGGIEASLRRFAHYDYWSDSIRRSILMDSRADILVYGMGERQILEIAERLKKGENLEGIRGTSIKTKKEFPQDSIKLPCFKEISTSKEAFCKSFLIQEREQEPFPGKVLVEEYEHCAIVQYPPALPMTEEEMDYIYELPFIRKAHPKYKEDIKSLEPVRFSIITHRGCFGNCSFCALSFHQGKFIQSRSPESILREIEKLTGHPEFKGYIDDLGGPTANMYSIRCCKYGHGKDFIEFPSIIDKSTKRLNFNSSIRCNMNCLGDRCKNLSCNNRVLTELLKKIRKIKGVKKAFVRSGVRYDLSMKDEAYLEELIGHHISGQMKVAPEHISPSVLELMNKPYMEIFENFYKKFTDINKKFSKKQYLIPYFIVSHPGSGKKEAMALRDYIRKNHIAIEQIQIFTPTPMTKSTCMYYTGMDPVTLKEVYIPRSIKEKEEQKNMLLYRKKSL